MITVAATAGNHDAFDFIVVTVVGISAVLVSSMMQDD
jgi:hypothetical protein